MAIPTLLCSTEFEMEGGAKEAEEEKNQKEDARGTHTVVQ
jgi:hypothetical protein